MKKQEFITHIKELVSSCPDSFKNDKPAVRMLFNDIKDAFHKDGTLTDSQCFNWILADRELKSILHSIKL